MYARPSRKKELARRTFTYVLMTVTSLLLVAMLMMMVLGYRFNFETQTVEQTGLVQYNSFPRGARVSVDGKLGERTQTKASILPGQRQFAMHLTGYETWQKTVDIAPGTVTWLSYVRLVPTEKVITSIQDIDRLSSAVASPDDRYIAGTASDEAGAMTFVLMDMRNSQQPTVAQYPIDTTKLAGFTEEKPATDHRLSVVRWSDSSRAVVLKHQYTLSDRGEQTDWLWIYREQPGVVHNLSSLLNLAISSVIPIDGKDVYILQSNGDVRQAAVDTGTISRPLLSQVTWFDVYGDETIAYVGRLDQERVAGVWQPGWQESTVLMSVPEANTQQMHIQVSEYFNKDTAVVSLGPSATVYRGAIPATDDGLAAFLQTATTFTLNRPVTHLQVSQNGRFVMAEDMTGFISYDIERQLASQGVKKRSTSPLRWLDGYHIWDIDATGQLVMEEYDGVNSYSLMPVSAGYDTLLTSDGRYIYGFLKEGETVKLQRLAMTL